MVEPADVPPPPPAPASSDPEIEAIVQARHGDAFAFLGMHKTADGVCVRAMLPQAQQVAVIDSSTGNVVAEGCAGPPRRIVYRGASPAARSRFAISCGSRTV